MQVEEIYLLEPGNWPTISENTGAIDNPPEEAIAESSPIREQH